MKWARKEIEHHCTAARLLTQVKDRVWDYLRKNPQATEYDTEQFVQNEFERRNLTATGKFYTQIVGFNAHAAIPHYFPSKRGTTQLRPNTLILLDIWAHLCPPTGETTARQALYPFADITWIAYRGEKVPNTVQRVFDIVIKARDTCLLYLTHKLARGIMPTGAEVDAVAEKVVLEAGHKKHILHRTGHCIGFTSPHGKGVNLSPRFRRPLERNVGYTIEPGIYLKGKFGIRSEINFYITNKNKVVVTTPMQRQIVRI